MARNFTLSESLIKHRFFVILQDVWGFALLLLISWFLKNKSSSNSLFDLFSRKKLFLIFRNWTEYQLNDPNGPFKVAATTLSISFASALIVSISVFTLHLYFPKQMKIISYIFLPFAILYFKRVFENKYLRISCALLAFILSAYELSRISYYFDYLAYDLSKKNLNVLANQKIIFYFNIFSQWLLLLIDVFALRLSDFSGINYFKAALVPLFVLTYVYSNAYSLSSNLIYYHARIMLLSTNPSSFSDIFYAFFNSRCFSIYKVALLCFSIPATIYLKLRSNFIEQSYLIENTKISPYICSLKRSSFISFVLFSNEKIWYSELRKQMVRINFREDLLASMIISWICIHSLISTFQEKFIRQYESFVIVFVHFIILIEIFNSYIFVLIFKTIYGSDPINTKLNPESEQSNSVHNIEFSKKPEEDYCISL